MSGLTIPLSKGVCKKNSVREKVHLHEIFYLCFFNFKGKIWLIHTLKGSEYKVDFAEIVKFEACPAYNQNTGKLFIVKLEQQNFLFLVGFVSNGLPALKFCNSFPWKAVEENNLILYVGIGLGILAE